MIVNNSSMQTYTFMAVSLSVARAASHTSPTTPPSDQPLAEDTVTLSPQATAAAASTVVGTPASDLVPGAPPHSRAARRVEALFTVLDADEDGSITEEEFTEGARALLRSAGDRHRLRRAHDEHHGDRDHEFRGTHRLGRKLERLFDRVDTNDDGAVTKGELTAALARQGSRPEPSGTTPSGSPDGGSTAPSTSAVAVSFVSVTYVAIARQSYSVVEHLESPPEMTSRLPAQLAA